jgi:2-amino-4-hydroxy-6-hydroxymethyldihydropteridine diphosphokinase
MELAYLSLGSNLGNRAGNLRQAIECLDAVGEVVRVSSFYETEPVEVIDQPSFLNCVVALNTEANAEELMAALMAIERKMGRVRSLSKGPRLIDIDILLFGSQIHKSAGLTLPHPAMHLRRFVLAPMAEIAPDVLHPVLRRSMAQLLESLPVEGQAVRIVQHPNSG